MPSPTPNRALSWPNHGGAVNAWDAPLNADFENLDQAFNTYPITIVSTTAGVTFNSSGAIISSTVATITLPASNALNFHYPITGTLARNITVVWSSVGGYYDVGNLSSGAFSVTATVNGSTTGGVTLPQGGRSFLVSDGANGSNGMYFGSNVFGDITVASLTAVSTVTGLDFKATGTGADIVPAGTTAQRPALSGGSTASPVNSGGERYNSDIKATEFSDGNYWRAGAIAQPLGGEFRNLVISSSAALSPTTQISLTANTVIVESTAPIAYRSSALSMTISSSFTGAGGLDAGGLANSTWYSVWVIYSSTGNTYNGLLSTSFTTPTMPSGYDCRARFGSDVTTGSAHFQMVLQRDDEAQYVVASGSTTANLPIMISGIQGDPVTGPTWVGAPVAGFVPTTAAAIKLVLHSAPNANAACAPNNSYGVIGSTSNPPPMSQVSATFPLNICSEFVLEGSNVYFASDSAGDLLACMGWRDVI